MTVWLTGFAELADRYDAFIVDQYGVLHDGRSPYPGVLDALQRLADLGLPVVVLSNSGKRSAANVARMAELGISPRLYTAFLSSGEVAWRLMAEGSLPELRDRGNRALVVARHDDRSITEGLDLVRVSDPADADFILLAGLDGATQSMADFEPALQVAAGRGLPMLCANPDMAAVTADGVVFATGQVAARYAELGGAVRTIGKPHRDIYLACAAWLRGAKPERVAAVGDSLGHDIAGAAAAGHASVLVTCGAHAAELAPGNPVQDGRLAGLCDRQGYPRPDWVLSGFAWNANAPGQP